MPTNYVCTHCAQPIRLHGGVWVHDDPDEDPTVEDYGWAKCLPNDGGSFEYAEPNRDRGSLTEDIEESS